MFRAFSVPDFPKLAWIATVDRASGDTLVEHGPAVETGPGFAVEGVWDGSFEEGHFHRAEWFFGSGLRVDAEGVWLVPSRALVDRVLLFEGRETYVASNSLPLLMARTGARLDPRHDYRKEARAILAGVDSYEDAVRLLGSNGRFRQLYYHPLRLEPRGTELLRRPRAWAFGTYGEYVRDLSSVLRSLWANAQSLARQVPLDGYTTVSRGYDSTAVTALVHELGLQAAFTSRRSNSTIRPWMNRRAAVDDGSPIAEHFGLDVEFLGGTPVPVDQDELRFLGATAAEPEVVFYPMARHIETRSEAAVVFSGYHGDVVWATRPPDPENCLTREILRTDTSGQNLGEARLQAGFINLPVPFVFAEAIGDLVAVSRSAEMAPWRIGGPYDRPIPRRILEEAGVPREAFGMRKKAVIQHYSYPKNPELRRDFFEHVRRTYGWAPSRIYALDLANRGRFLATRTLEHVLRFLAPDLALEASTPSGRPIDLPYELHLWALERLRSAYGDLLRRRQESALLPAIPRSRSVWASPGDDS